MIPAWGPPKKLISAESHDIDARFHYLLNRGFFFEAIFREVD